MLRRGSQSHPWIFRKISFKSTPRSPTPGRCPPSSTPTPASCSPRKKESSRAPGRWLATPARSAAPGDYFTTELLGEPLLLVRGSDGELRGFYNVCRHRAGPPAEGCGSRKLFRCGYHGWTYALDGSLLSATEVEGVEGLSARRFRSAAGAHRGMVQPGLRESRSAMRRPLRESLGELPKQAEKFPFAGMKLFERRTYDMKCNWKTYVDNYLEGYHLPSVHPGLNRELDFNAYMVEPYAQHVRQFSPIRGAQPGDTTPRRYQEAREDLTTDYFWIFPNWMLNCYPDNVSLNIVLPVEAGALPGDLRMVFAGEGSRRAGGEGLGRVQRPDSDRRCRHLRNRAEESALAQLFARALQREAGKRRACLPSHVWRIHAA